MECLGIRMKFVGENHEETCVVYSKLGSCFQRMRNYEEGERYLTKCLKIRDENNKNNDFLKTDLNYQLKRLITKNNISVC
jgi:hypothetical protein